VCGLRQHQLAKEVSELAAGLHRADQASLHLAVSGCAANVSLLGLDCPAPARVCSTLLPCQEPDHAMHTWEQRMVAFLTGSTQHDPACFSKGLTRQRSVPVPFLLRHSVRHTSPHFGEWRLGHSWQQQLQRHHWCWRCLQRDLQHVRSHDRAVSQCPFSRPSLCPGTH
jgi:hypothetical protein